MRYRKPCFRGKYLKCTPKYKAIGFLKPDGLFTKEFPYIELNFMPYGIP